MGGFRPRVHLIAFVTVALQLAVPAFASAALCCKDPAALAGNTAELMECCKKGGAHICPMKKPARPAKTTDHTMTSCCKPDAKIFVALLGTAGVIAAPAPVLLPPPASPHGDAASPAAPLWIAVASSPPPKA